MGQYTPVSAAAWSTGWAGGRASELLYSLCISSHEHCYKMSQVLLFWSFGYVVLLLFPVGAVSLSTSLTGACCSDADKWGFVAKLPGLSTLLLARWGFFLTKRLWHSSMSFQVKAWPGKMPSDSGITVCLAVGNEEPPWRC